MFTGFKYVTFITVSNMLMILSKNMWGKYKETGSRHLDFIGCGIMKSSRPMSKLRKSLSLQIFLICTFFLNFTERNVKKKFKKRKKKKKERKEKTGKVLHFREKNQN